MIAGKKYSPRTRTSRRPTPERFVHLRRWIEPIERNIELTTVSEITNIDQQLEQSSKLFISNVIQRAIAQLVAAYDDGFVTLQATEAGHLITRIAEIAGTPGALQLTADGILQTQNERERKTVTSAKIDSETWVDGVIVAGVTGTVINITTLMFTVGNETNITLYNGDEPITGPMDFGGADEPRGMVVSMGFLPYKLTAGSSFIIDSSEDVQISGFLTGYIE
ncbi:hypothetical protein ES708_11812 [subsurface metagenome]